ncbi:2610_t:CDS:2 [Dentiscutata heterogama]|uniref:2610_t:CDS:1 n=1 Tax=Dentiscutata heterogama TaxID=1316150 RepID=A0ACA9K8E9_9GLOM|nr:2610_t:CDS:2 [Dentiscutata heterogama]
MKYQIFLFFVTIFIGIYIEFVPVIEAWQSRVIFRTSMASCRAWAEDVYTNRIAGDPPSHYHDCDKTVTDIGTGSFDNYTIVIKGLGGPDGRFSIFFNYDTCICVRDNGFEKIKFWVMYHADIAHCYPDDCYKASVPEGLQGGLLKF